MPLIKVKLFENDTVADLNTAVAAYKAGAGAELLTSQRGMASDLFYEPDGDKGMMLALAHGGQDVPVSKFGDLEHALVMGDGDLVAQQARVDAALAASVFKTVADGVTTAAGIVTSATMTFEAEDVGRKLRIIESGVAVEKTITVFNGATSVSYDNAAGNFVAGTGKTVSLLGAEVLQDMEIGTFKSRGGKMSMLLSLALGGQVA